MYGAVGVTMYSVLMKFRKYPQLRDSSVHLPYVAETCRESLFKSRVSLNYSSQPSHLWYDRTVLVSLVPNVMFSLHILLLCVLYVNVYVGKRVVLTAVLDGGSV